MGDRPSAGVLVLVLIFAVLAVSTAALLVRWGTVIIHSLGMEPTIGFSIFLAAGRLGLAALFLSPQMGQLLLGGKLQSRSGLIWALLAGVGLAAHFSLWFSSLNYTSIAASTTLVTTTPLWTALIEYLWYGQKLTPWSISGIAIACGGSILIGLADLGNHAASQPLLGNGLALIAAWAVSFYFIAGQRAQRQGLEIQPYTAIATTTAALILLPIPLLLGMSYGGWPPQMYLVLGLLALIPQLLGHTSLNWAIRWLSPTWVTLAVLGEPIAASLLALWFFQEVPPPLVLVGGCGVLLGVGLAIAGRERQPN